MKKIFVYAAIAALAITAISCQKENLNDNGNISSDGLVFTASIDCGMDTKTTLTSEKRVNWEATDEITINGVVYTAAPKSDATKADFTKKNSGDADPTCTFNAFYPTGIQTEATAGGTLPAEQTYTAEKITNLPMFATSTTTSLSFKNICAVLAVTVKSADFPSVKSIKVSSSNCALSGAFTVSDGQTATLTSDAQTAKAAVILNCGTDAVATASEGTLFYIAIPAQTYQNLKIELSSDGSSYTKSMTTKKDADITVAVNTVYPLTFKADAAATKGTAKATIDGKEVDVDWVQLWKDGPKFAVKNVGADVYTDKGSMMNYADAVKSGSYYVWGSNWKTPTKDEMDLLNAVKVSCEYCLENGVYGFRFTGAQEDYTGNSLFLPAHYGITDYGITDYDITDYGITDYWSSSADGDDAWNLFLGYNGNYSSNWNTFEQYFECYVLPVLSN